MQEMIEMQQELNKDIIFSTFDMRSGYHHAALSPES